MIRYPLAILTLFLLTSLHLRAQSDGPQLALKHIQNNQENWKLTDSDVTGIQLISNHKSRTTGAHFMYFQQFHNGIPIEGAYLNMTVHKDGKVYQPRHSLIPDAASKVSLSVDGDMQPAIQASMKELDIQSSLNMRVINTRDNLQIIDAPWAASDIHAVKQYHLTEEGTLRLTYQVELPDGEDHLFWRMVVDAETLEILAREKTTVECNHTAHMFTQRDECGEVIQPEQVMVNTGTGSYRVYPLPAMSPDEIVHGFISPQADTEASPFRTISML